MFWWNKICGRNCHTSYSVTCETCATLIAGYTSSVKPLWNLDCIHLFLQVLVSQLLESGQIGQAFQEVVCFSLCYGLCCKIGVMLSEVLL